jgi:tellurite resistance protein
MVVEMKGRLRHTPETAEKAGRVAVLTASDGWR